MVSQDDAPDTKKQFTGLLRKTDGSPEAPSALYYRLWSCFETSSSLTTFCFTFGILVTSYQMTGGSRSQQASSYASAITTGIGGALQKKRGAE